MRLLLLTAIVLAFTGCNQFRTIEAGAVELEPHTYAMSANAFDAWAFNEGHRAPFVTVFNSTSECGLFRPYASTSNGVAYTGGDCEGLTVWKPHGATICAIKCTDPHHLSYEDTLKLLHERAHRDDFRLGQEGASPLWILLSQCREGQFFLTHESINAHLRSLGYSAP
jgi:hypothetical protein